MRAHAGVMEGSWSALGDRDPTYVDLNELMKDEWLNAPPPDTEFKLESEFDGAGPEDF